MNRLSRVILFAVAASTMAAPVASAETPMPSHEHAAAGSNGGDTGGGGGGETVPSVDLDSPAARLRIDLDRLLAEHAFLTMEQMRSGLVGSPDFAAAAQGVEANTTEIATAIGAIYGEEAVDPFGEIWRAHIGYVVDYAVALGSGDDAGRQQALDGLAEYRRSLGEFLASANPEVSLEGIAEAIEMHDAHLVEFIDAVHAGDHARAYQIERESYRHMFEIGDALARVVANRFPDTFPGLDVAYSRAGTLRVTLDRLLGEHAFLAAEAMRGSLTGADFVTATENALDDNSAELQGLVEAAYGRAAAVSFRGLWDAHIDAYLAYIEVVRGGDAASLQPAARTLDDYAAQLAEFLATANPNLDANALATLLREHARHLTGQVDAFMAGDYDGTYRLVRDGYRHMFTAGEALAVGLATQMPDKFPAAADAPDTSTAPAPDGFLTTLAATAVWIVAMVLGLAGRRWAAEGAGSGHVRVQSRLASRPSLGRRRR